MYRPNTRRPSGPRRPPNRQHLLDLLRRANIHLLPEQVEQLWTFHGLLRENNHDRDLTRIIGFENIVQKHYVDSMYVGQLVKLRGPLLDIGTGAGFPGVPLKIRYPNLPLILAEPRPRRVAFLERVCRELGFKNVEVFPHRVVSRSFTKPVAGVITRALETIPKTILRTTGCTDVGSRFVFLKGPAVDPELDEALTRFRDELRLVQDREYALPGTPNSRRLIVLERTKAPRVVHDEVDDADADDGDGDGEVESHDARPSYPARGGGKGKAGK